MKKILVVDDDVRLLNTIRKVLEATGAYEVRVEDSGRRALATAPSFKPDLIMLDMNMPEVGGVEFLKAISTPEGKLEYPVLVMTTRANMVRFFDDIPVDGFVAKPCDPDDLRMEVDRIVFLKHGAKAEPTPERAAGTAQKKILVGEDDRDVGRRLVGVLRRAGYAVDCVVLGPQLLEKAIVQKPDAVLVKLILTGLNGDAVARMLKEMPNTKDIPVILYDATQNKMNEGKVVALQASARKYVRSDEPQALLSAIAEVL